MQDFIQALRESINTFKRVRAAQRVVNERERQQLIRWASATEQELARWGRQQPSMADAERKRRARHA